MCELVSQCPFWGNMGCSLNRSRLCTQRALFLNATLKMCTRARGGIVPYAMKQNWGCSEVGERQGIPMGCDAFFWGSFQPVLRSLCSPHPYLAFLYHNPPLHLNMNTNMCKYHCSLVSSGLVSFYKCQKSSPPFHEWNRKHWTALLPNKTVCSRENIVLQMPSFKHAFNIHLKVQVDEIGE